MSVDNISKILFYVEMVTKDPIDADGTIYYKRKEHIKLQQSFFYVDGCVNCGGCCVAESNVYTPKEYEHIMKCTEAEFNESDLDYSEIYRLREGIHEEIHIINGKEIPFYVYDLEKNNMFLPVRNKILPRCSWLKLYDDGNYKCKIHPVVSLTCDMPHLRFTYSTTGTVSVGTQQFGRNWALKCPVKFLEPQNEEHFNQIRESRIRKLNRIDHVANELGVETWVPEMIKYINKIPFENYHDFLGRDVVSLHNRFFGREL